MSPLIQPLESGQEGFLRDESRKSGTAESIAFPKSEAEVTAVTRFFKGWKNSDENFPGLGKTASPDAVSSNHWKMGTGLACPVFQTKIGVYIFGGCKGQVRLQFDGGGPGDHRGIVCAEARRREPKRNSGFFGQCRQFFA